MLKPTWYEEVLINRGNTNSLMNNVRNQIVSKLAPDIEITCPKCQYVRYWWWTCPNCW